MNEDVARLADALDGVGEEYAPRTVGMFNDIMAVKALGEFDWHAHDDTDDLRPVLKGQLEIRMRDRHVTFGSGDLFIVLRSVEHQPYAAEETHLLLIEPAGTPNTGDPATPQRLVSGMEPS